MTERLKRMKLYMWTRIGDQRGVTMVEYAIMLALVGLTVVAFGPEISRSIQDVFTETEGAL